MFYLFLRVPLVELLWALNTASGPLEERLTKTPEPTRGALSQHREPTMHPSGSTVDWFYDRPPPPPRNQRFSFTNVSWRCSTWGRLLLTQGLHIYTYIYIFIFFLVFNGLSNNHVWMARGTVFLQEIRPGGVGFETGDFVEEKLGGAIVVRLHHCTTNLIRTRARWPPRTRSSNPPLLAQNFVRK